MLGDIRNDLKPREYEITLCKPDRTTIAYLTDIYNITYNANYQGIDEITFDVPYYIEDNNHNKIKNYSFDLIKGDYLLFINNEKYFIIDTPEENGDQGVDIKTIHAYSLEYGLIYKNLRLFRGTRKLYDTTSEKAGILNLLEEETYWRVGYIDEKVKMDTNGSHEKYRTFDISEKTWLDVLNEDICEAFECVLIFDTINKTINIYDKESYGENKGLYISEISYLKTIGKKTEHNKIVTRLYVYGKDNISINSVNPLGTDYIENFDYYKNTDYMSQSLIDKLNQYEGLLESKTKEFQGYNNNLNGLYENLILKETEISKLNTEMQIILDNIDTAILADAPYGDLNIEKTNKQNEIDVAKSEKDSIQAQIDSVLLQIQELQQLLDKKNNFTSAELEQLDYFTKIDSMQDNYISDVIELYNTGKKYLAEKNIPPITFSIDVVDFLKIVEYQYDWDKLVLGDKINIEYERLGINVEVRLVGYSHDYDGNSLNLEFANKNETNDEYDKISGLLSNASNVVTSFDIFKNQWDTAYSNVSETQSFMNSALNTARNIILGGRNQNIILDQRGIHVKDLNSDMQQVRIMNGIICFTSDNWQSADLAITSKGIVGESIYSKIIGSEKLIITNSAGKFEVDKDKMTATDMILSLTTTRGNGKIFIDPNVGIKIQSNGRDTLYMDTNGNINLYNGYIKLDSGSNTIRIDPSVGIKIQDTYGRDVFYADTDGSLTLRDIKILGELDGTTSVFIDSTGIATKALKGEVINFDNGASLDTRSGAVRLRWTNEDYVFISDNGFTYYQNGSALFNISSSGAYFRGNRLATEAYVNSSIPSV